MKMRSGLTLLGLVVFCGGMLALTAATPAEKPTTPTATMPANGEVIRPDRVVVYYFHTTQRCPTCRRIEQWSDLALRTAFAAELADSSLVFLPVNTDEKGNEHFVKDYELYTKSLIVIDLKDGARQGWENLQKVWEYSGDQEKFFAYVQDGVRNHLAGKRGGERG
ncbi:MAG: nitrophenyl compound nitroreductase subunit ArsF family protein [Candidatus Krumholzibacteriia bacterium]